jgi:predicted aldo/keto reductase-like oxidoreductase
MVKETERDKRIGKILAKLKTEGLIKKIGFSAHLKYELLYYWVEEMEKAFGPEFLQVAMVSFNILNDKKDNWLAKFYNITVWDAAGKEGIDYLKSKNMTLIDMMPTESGRIGQVSMNQDWFNWAHRYIRDYSSMDYVLLGSHYIKHLEPAVKIYKRKDLEELPDMRIINAAKPGHCHE